MRSMRMRMVRRFALKLFVESVNNRLVLGLMLALATSLGIRNLVGKRLIELLGFSPGLLLILMVLCITGTINLLLLDLSCVG